MYDIRHKKSFRPLWGWKLFLWYAGGTRQVILISAAFVRHSPHDIPFPY